MEHNPASATQVASASDAEKSGEAAANGSLTSATKQVREKDDHPQSVSTAHGGEKGDSAGETETTHLSSSKEKTAGTLKTCHSPKAEVETSPGISTGPPLVTPTCSAATPSRQKTAANEESSLGNGLRAELPASADLPDGVEKCDSPLSSSHYLDDARTRPHTTSSPAPYPSYFSKGSGPVSPKASPAGRMAAEDGGSGDTVRLSLLSMPQEEVLHPHSLPSSARGRDDIIEVVVQRPKSGTAAVPYFSPEKNGLTLPAPAEPLFQDTSRVYTEGYVCVPAGKAVQALDHFQLQQQRLQGQRQQQEQLFQDQQLNRYVAAPPGVFVLHPQLKWKNGKYVEGDLSVGKQFPAYPPCAPISFFPRKLVAPGLLYSENYLPYSEEQRERYSERSILRGLPPSGLYSETVPLEMRWNVQQRSPQYYTDDAALGMIQRKEPGSPLLFPQAIPRTLQKGAKVVVPNAKQLLCFGHAGDERKFCFGLLQLPPPTLKYDFLVERKAVCCGVCEDVQYVAICRKCRMRLPTCPYCGKQSAVRHP